MTPSPIIKLLVDNSFFCFILLERKSCAEFFQWRIYHQSWLRQPNPSVVWHDKGQWRLDRFSETFGRLCRLLSWVGILQKWLWKIQWRVLTWKRQPSSFNSRWWRHTELTWKTLKATSPTLSTRLLRWQMRLRNTRFRLEDTVAQLVTLWLQCHSHYSKKP